MQKQICEISKQAREHADTFDDAHTPIWFQMYNEKFAELIVMECAKQIKTQGISVSSEDYGDYEVGFNAGLFHATRTTKEHFGLEE